MARPIARNLSTNPDRYETLLDELGQPSGLTDTRQLTPQQAAAQSRDLARQQREAGGSAAANAAAAQVYGPQDPAPQTPESTAPPQSTAAPMDKVLLNNDDRSYGESRPPAPAFNYGSANRDVFSGHNLDRAFGGTDSGSTKDAYARAVARSGADFRGKSMEETESLLQSLLPILNEELAALGLGSATGVNKDKIYFDVNGPNYGPGWVDVVQGAGGGAGLADWMPDADGSIRGCGGGGGVGSVGSGGTGSVFGANVTGGGDIVSQIQQALAAMSQGGNGAPNIQQLIEALQAGGV